MKILSCLLAGKLLGNTTQLIARSSANVEDLAGMSAAGLYDSIGGIEADNQHGFKVAVAKVWASLFTQRASLSSPGGR